MATTLLFIPGLWEGPTVFTQVSKILSSPPHNFNTYTASLRSTGTTSLGNPSMKDDIIALRSVIKNLVELTQEEVILVLHSAGGFLGSEAMMGYDRKAREAKGLKGGVIGIVFVAGAIAPKGHLHTPLPFMDFKSASPGEMTCVEPRRFLFNDLDEQQAEKWEKLLEPQPAEGWDGTTTYCGWKDVPSAYLLCAKDAVIPEAVQAQMAGLAGSEVFRCGAGHVPMLSMPGKIVEVISSFAKGL